MLVLPLLSVVLTCDMESQFTRAPQHGMGVRFTRRGLEKFCQKGYSIVPDIITRLPPFPDIPIKLGSVTITLSNIKVLTVRVSTMNVYLLKDNYVKMEDRDGLMQLSMRLNAVMAGLAATVDCIFTLRDFGVDVSMRIGDNPRCHYHLGMFDIKNAIYMSKLDIDTVGLNTGGAVLANFIQGMRPALEGLLKKTILKVLIDTIFNAVKEFMTSVSIVVREKDYRTDQRYLNGINVVDQKIVADQGGYSMIINTKDKSVVAEYPTAITSPPPKTVYTDREYEFYVDREAINSYLYVWHKAHDKFKATSLVVPYSTIKSEDMPGLKELLIKENILNDENDAGDDVTIALAVQPPKETAPRVPWISAAAVPVNISGTLTLTAAKRNSPTSKVLADISGSMLFSAILRLTNFKKNFTDVQLRAYLVITDLIDFIIDEESAVDINTLDPLLKYMMLNNYLPFLNQVLHEPGVCLLNGNFVNLTTVTPVYLCNEDRVLFTADIETNQYFP